ncbi:MAG TPA: hypothetical protein VMF69_02090 [Gemmataceae bacterium]|nr:hypothetical protein [Gemmataceae bacterium]
MSIRQGSDETLIAAIHAAPKALVFLSVPWSCPERIARQYFVDAAAQLSELSLGVECFLIDEEAEACRTWLSALNLPQVGKYPLGAGSLLWLEDGRIVTFKVSGQIPAGEIITRCKQLWASGS